MRARTEQQIKQFVRRTIGEPYVGKRLKLRWLNQAMPRSSATHPFGAILDFGTEDATFVYWLADRFPDASVTAIDLDEAAMETCRDLIPASYVDRVEFETTRLEDLPEASFDLITTFDVLEHIEDDVKALGHLARVLRPGGRLLIHVPRDQWTDSHGRVERVPDSEAWQINSGHVRMGYSPKRLSALVADAGLEVVTIDIWVRRWGVRAFSVYGKLESPAPLRLLSVPFTDLAAILDKIRPRSEGNTVWLEARKPAVV